MIYDVVIIGGGPGGSALGTLLAKKGHSVCILEKEHFPRDHIGESFSHRLIGVLEEIGVLEKVLTSNIAIRKFGGYYAWDPAKPAATFFDHHASLKDGVRRWSVHVNRAEFDKLLLDHAEECGAVVRQGVQVREVERGEPHHLVHTSEKTYEGRFVVEAFGRQSRTFLEESPREWLSRFKNVGVWNHFTGGKQAQSVDADWNVFHKEDLSCIGSFAYERGWAWYIPVMKEVNGEWRETHSIGIITSPDVLKQSRDELLSLDGFMQELTHIPILRDLIHDIEPVFDEVKTAANYSMIQENFCSREERWVRIGDAAYFVDPLFSSGVTFALAHAGSASVLLDQTLKGTLDDQKIEMLWSDYDQSWRTVATSFSAAIDQWYHAIGTAHPNSTYWKNQTSETRFDYLAPSFQLLVDTDTSLSPDLLQVVGDGEKEVLDNVAGIQLDALPSEIRLRKGVTQIDGVQLMVGYTKGATTPFTDQQAIADFWADPVKNGPALPGAFDVPIAASYLKDESSCIKVPRGLENFVGRLLNDDIEKPSNGSEARFLNELQAADMLESN